jgi:SAM-dependent methyltransferase
MTGSAATEKILAAHAAGALSAGMALTRLLLLHRDLEAVRRLLAPGTELAAELDTRWDGAVRAASILVAADAADSLDACRRLFDAAVAVSGPAAVALYSLGDEALLAEATAEVVGLLEALGIAALGRHLLDLGCGIGRLEAALAPKVAAITGIDLSPAMIRAAETRCAGLANVRLLQCLGRDLGMFPDGSFDAVIAVDSFPYLYQAGGEALALAHVREAARVLRAGGDLLVLNLSYRGDLARDRADAQAFALAAGLDLRRAGTADLRTWDGRTFHWRQMAQPAQDRSRP